MNMNSKGLALLKKFEGCRLTAYWDVDGYSIGYGHHSNVNKNDKITQAQAEAFLKEDLAKYEKAVSSLSYNLNENQFSALVDFAYNCGIGNLKNLTDNSKRSLSVVADKMLLYCKAGGVSLPGLYNRRKAERELFVSPIDSPVPTAASASDSFYPEYVGEGRSIINALKEVGESDTSLKHRAEIAEANGYVGKYSGQAAANLWMLDLLKQGLLRRG